MLVSTRTQSGGPEHWTCHECDFQYNMHHNTTCCACDRPNGGRCRQTSPVLSQMQQLEEDGGERTIATRQARADTGSIVPASWTEVGCEDDLPSSVKIGQETETFVRLKQELSGVGEVIAILRCEDYDLWESFVREKKKVLKRLKRRDDFVDWSVGPHCYQSGNESELYDSSRSKTLHERLLFHTANASVAAIFEEGFDTRLSSPGNFGRGIYFSDDPKKCDRYWRGGAGTRVMFVAQVALGEAKVYPRGQNDKALTREPERYPNDSRPGRRSCYDSVKGHISVADEFVIYQNARAFPMFAVHYEPRQPVAGHARAGRVRSPGIPHAVPRPGILRASTDAARRAREEQEELRELERALELSLAPLPRAVEDTEQRELEQALQLSMSSDQDSQHEEGLLAAALQMSLDSSTSRSPKRTAAARTAVPPPTVETEGSAKPSLLQRRQLCWTAAEDRSHDEQVRSALVPGMWVRARRKAEDTIAEGDVGTYVQTNAGTPPCQVRWRQYGATFWVQWADIEVIGWEEPVVAPTVAMESFASIAGLPAAAGLSANVGAAGGLDAAALAATSIDALPAGLSGLPPAIGRAASAASSGDSAVANAATTSTQLYSRQIVDLMLMGFDESVALDALRKTAGDQEAAVNLLLG